MMLLELLMICSQSTPLFISPKAFLKLERAALLCRPEQNSATFATDLADTVGKESATGSIRGLNRTGVRGGLFTPEWHTINIATRSSNKIVIERSLIIAG